MSFHFKIKSLCLKFGITLLNVRFWNTESVFWTFCFKSVPFFKTVFYAWEKSGVRRMGDGESCCRQNSFFWEDNLQLGNRGFYVPPSPVIGCHWSCVRGKRLHGPFPDFPGDFPPTAFCVYGVKTKTPRLAILKKKKNRPSFVSLRSHRTGAHLRLCGSPAPGWLTGGAFQLSPCRRGHSSSGSSELLSKCVKPED